MAELSVVLHIDCAKIQKKEKKKGKCFCTFWVLFQIGVTRGAISISKCEDHLCLKKAFPAGFQCYCQMIKKKKIPR